MNLGQKIDGFVCETHTVSFAIPLIFKSCLDLRLKLKPARTKPQGDQLENVPLVPYAGRKPLNFIFLMRFVFFFP